MSNFDQAEMAARCHRGQGPDGRPARGGLNPRRRHQEHNNSLQTKLEHIGHVARGIAIHEFTIIEIEAAIVVYGHPDLRIKSKHAILSTLVKF